MKPKTQQDIIRFAPSKHFQSLVKEEAEDNLDNLDQQLAEKLAEAIDEYFELTGEPVSLFVSSALHIAELAEIISGSSGESRHIVITPSALQDEYEDDFY